MFKEIVSFAAMAAVVAGETAGLQVMKVVFDHCHRVNITNMTSSADLKLYAHMSNRTNCDWTAADYVKVSVMPAIFAAGVGIRVYFFCKKKPVADNTDNANREEIQQPISIGYGTSAQQE